MTKIITGKELQEQIVKIYPDAVVDWDNSNVWIDPNTLKQVAVLLNQEDSLDFQVLVSISAVDYIEYFELVYRFLSMRRNHSGTVKLRCYGREEIAVDSVVDVWKGADLQEREIWDLMGICFEGHPNMKRILLWEEFSGHPLRKDFVR